MREIMFAIEYIGTFMFKYLLYMGCFVVVFNWMSGQFEVDDWKVVLVLIFSIFMTGRLIFKDLIKLYREYIREDL